MPTPESQPKKPEPGLFAQLMADAKGNAEAEALVAQWALESEEASRVAESTTLGNNELVQPKVETGAEPAAATEGMRAEEELRLIGGTVVTLEEFKAAASGEQQRIGPYDGKGRR